MPCQHFSCTWGCLSVCGSCIHLGCSRGAGGSQPDVCSSVVSAVHWSLSPSPSVATGKGASSAPLLSPPPRPCPPAWRVHSWTLELQADAHRAQGRENQVAPAGFPVLHLPVPSASCPLLLRSLSTPSKGLQLCTCLHRGHSAGCSRTGLGFICLSGLTHKAGTEGTWFRQELKVLGSGRSGSQCSPHGRVAGRGLSSPLEEVSPPPG